MQAVATRTMFARTQDALFPACLGIYLGILWSRRIFITPASDIFLYFLEYLNSLYFLSETLDSSEEGV